MKTAQDQSLVTIVQAERHQHLMFVLQYVGMVRFFLLSRVMTAIRMMGRDALQIVKELTPNGFALKEIQHLLQNVCQNAEMGS